MNDPGSALERWNAGRLTIPSRRRLDALLEFEDAELAVRSVPAEELYLALSEVGLSDCVEIIQLSSPSQFKTFIDLGVWEKDRLSIPKFLGWLRLARGELHEAYQSKLDRLDIETLELLLRATTVVHDVDEEGNTDFDGMAIETPEGRYLIEIGLEGVEGHTVQTLVNDLIAQNPFEASRFFEATRWEMPSELEEIAYRFRQGRLEDLGFPPIEEALSLYAFLSPRSVRRVSPVRRLKVANDQLAVGPGRQDYWKAMLANSSPQEKHHLEESFRYLVNSLLVADGAEVGDLDALRQAGERALDCLGLGLEFLSGSDPTRASEVPRQYAFKQIFQIAFSLTLELQFEAKRMDRPLLLKEQAHFFKTLLRKRPLRALSVEGAEPVAFRSLAEIEGAHARLKRCEVESRILRALTKNLGPAPEGWDADKIFVSLLGQVLVNPTEVMELRIRPITVPQIAIFCGNLFEGEPLQPRIRSNAVAQLRAVLCGQLEVSDHETLYQMIDSTNRRLMSDLARPYLLNGRLEREVFHLLPVEPLTESHGT